MKTMTKKQTANLIKFLKSKLETTSCNHSLRFSIEWAEIEGYDPDYVIEFLNNRGGYCDCEVIMNVPNAGMWN